MRGRKIVRAADDAEQPGRPLCRIGTSIERAMVGDRVTAQAGHLAVLRGRDFRLHVEVARKCSRRKILDAILDPFYRTAGHDRSDDRADVTRIGANLVAKAAADIGGDHVNLVLWNLRNQRAYGPDDVRRLERAPQSELTFDLVE